MTLAGVAAGSGGCLVECHLEPSLSISDADQAITPFELSELSYKINKVREAIR
jgi:3-deoxy-D-arabino-heptulosonate 7-phosphate (DAHP) synthase